MRDGGFILAIGLMVFGGVLLWRSGRDVFHPFQGSSTPMARQLPETAPAVKPVAVAPKARLAPAPLVEPVAVVAAAPKAPVVAAPVVPAEPPPFPVLDEIVTGLPQDSITTTYGEPAVSALTSSGGHVVETLVYTRDRGHSATVIHLEDGRVAAAYTKWAPAQVSGVSIPRRRSSGLP
jgi:hypothetical protein